MLYNEPEHEGRMAEYLYKRKSLLPAEARFSNQITGSPGIISVLLMC